MRIGGGGVAGGPLRALRMPPDVPFARLLLLPLRSVGGRPRADGLPVRFPLPGECNPLLLRCVAGVAGDIRCRATLQSVDMCSLRSPCRTSRPHAGQGTIIIAILRAHWGI